LERNVRIALTGLVNAPIICAIERLFGLPAAGAGDQSAAPLLVIFDYWGLMP
jgi:hypothetical protein